MPVIALTDSLSIDEAELVERFVKASGPGGQHVNTTSSAVELRFDVLASPNLPPAVKSRLVRLAGSRATQGGVIVLFGQGERSQHLNRLELRERLFELIRKATVVLKKRRPTRPSKAAKAKRVDAKKVRSRVKALRGKPTD